MSKKLQQNPHRSIIEQIIRIANKAVIGQEHTEELLKHLFGIPSSSQGPIRPTLPMTGNDLDFTVLDEGVDEYKRLLERLLQKEGWSDKFSEEYLDKALQQLLATLLQEEQIEYASAERLFIQLRESYKGYNQKRVVYLPVCQIKLDTDTYRMGNILFRKVTDTFFDNLIQKLDNITLQTTNTPEEKAASMQSTRRQIESLRGSIIAEFSVIADAQRAQERAEDEVNIVLDLLRYSAAILYPKGLRVAIGLQGEVISAIRTTVILSLDGQSWKLMNSRQGPWLSPSAFTLKDTVGEIRRRKTEQ